MVLTNEMNQIPGEKILKEILNGNDKVLTKIYKQVYRQIAHMSSLSNAGADEMKEAVQDAFEIFYRQLYDNQLQLTCSIETYIVSIAKRILSKQSRDYHFSTNKSTSEGKELADEVEEFKDWDEWVQNERHNLFLEEFKKLDKDCQKIITLSLKGFEAKVIKKKMKLGSEQYVKIKRQRCKTYLIEKIKENPKYEKLRNAKPEDIELFI